MQNSRIWKQFETLPPSAQRQVADFIAFLSTRTRWRRSPISSTRVPLREDAFVGLWREREDLQESTAWVRRLRSEEWT